LGAAWIGKPSNGSSVRFPCSAAMIAVSCLFWVLGIPVPNQL
jgi:hypothetical protein